MTPLDLRVRADQFLAGARSCALSGQLDVAAHNAGLAAEMALKAAYCAKMGWQDFPLSDKESLQRGGERCFIHDLTKLLQLSDSVMIPAFASIDWGRVSDWRIEHRYPATKPADLESTIGRIDDTDMLCRQLRVHALLRFWMKLHADLFVECGWFNLFAAQERSDGTFELVLAAPWLNPGNAEHLKLKFREVRSGIDSDLRNRWTSSHFVDKSYPDFLALVSVHRVYGPNTVVAMKGDVILGAHPSAFDGFVMACNWDAPPSLAAM